MRLKSVCLAAALAVLSAGSAFAAKVTFHGNDQYRRDNGGEFQARVWSGYAGETGKASDNVVGGRTTRGTNGNAYVSFQTFCLELDELVDLNPGTPQNAANQVTTTISDTAQLGGVNTDAGDRISAQTAYLYTQFRNGTLAGYAYNDFTTADTRTAMSRRDTGRALQLAFWVLENELAGVPTNQGNPFGDSIENLAASYISQANAAVAGSWGNTIGNVRVVNYLRTNGQFGQSMLTLVPLPASVWMGISLLCAAGAATYMRRRAMQA